MCTVCLLFSPDEGSGTALNVTEHGDVSSNTDEIDDDVDIDAEDDMVMSDSDVAGTCSESDVLQHELSDAESQEGNDHLEQPMKLPRTSAGPPGITSWSSVQVVPVTYVILGTLSTHTQNKCFWQFLKCSH